MRKIFSIIVLLMLCSGLVWFASIVSGPDETSSTTADAKTEPNPTNTPEPVPAYTEIRENIETMTEAQWESFAETLKGKAINEWTGTVKDVDQTLGSYTVLVSVGNRDNQVSVPVEEDQALTFNKGDEVTFSGTVSSVTWVLGLVNLYLGDATIE